MSIHYDYEIYVSLQNSESEVPGNYATDNAVVTRFSWIFLYYLEGLETE